MSRKHLHQRRNDDTWSVKGVLIVHPPKPTLSKREAIGEGVLDWLDIAEQVNCLNDGLVIDCESIDWDLTKPPSAPYRSESRRYDVRIAVALDTKAKAKQPKADIDYGRDRDPYTGQAIVRRPGGFIAVTTRRTRR